MIDALLRHGAELLAGATLLLALGCLAVRFSRRPLHAQRRGELCLLAVLLFVPAALLPLPRHGRDALRAAADFVLPAAAVPAPASSDGAQDAAAGAKPAARRSAARRLLAGVDPLAGALHGAAPSRTTHASLRDLAPSAASVDAHSPTAHPPAVAHSPTAQPRAALAPDTLAAPNAHLAADDLALSAPTDASREPVAAPDLTGTQDLALGALAHDESRESREPPAAAKTDAARDTARALALVFLAGAALSLAWLALGVLRLRRVLRATYPAPAWLTEWIDAAAPDLRLRVLVGPAARSPFCVGLLRQTIVLPPALLHGGRRGLRSVLAHELAHARHGDGRGRLLAALALPVLWFHPLYWWLRGRIALSAELLADDHAAAGDRPAYARELIDLVQRLPRTPALPAGARPVFGAPQEFTRRIEMLLQRRDRLDTRCSAVARGAHSLFLVALVLLGGTVFGAAPLNAQSADAAEAKAEIARLHAERDELRAQVDRMQAEMGAMRAALEKLTSAMRDGQLQRVHADERAALKELAQRQRTEELRALESELKLRAAEQAQVAVENVELKRRVEAEVRQAELAALKREAELAASEGDMLHAKESLARLHEIEAKLHAEAKHRAAEARVSGRPALVDPYIDDAHAAHGHGASSAPHAHSGGAAGGVAVAPKHGVATGSGFGVAHAPSAPAAVSAHDEAAPAVPSKVHPAPTAAPAPAAHPAHPSPAAHPAPAVAPAPAVSPAPAVAPVPPAPATDLGAMLDMAEQLIDVRTQLDLRARELAETASLVEAALAPESLLRTGEAQMRGLELRLGVLEGALDNGVRSARHALERAHLALKLASEELDGPAAKLERLAAEHRVVELAAQLELLEQLR